MDIFETHLENLKLNQFNFEILNEELQKVINYFDENGRTLLHWAAFLGNNKVMLHLLQAGANTSLISENEENFQAIHFAAVNNHTECIQTLLDFGVSIESCDMFRRTPLCIAAFYGRIIASVFLLSKKANLEHQDMNGNNSLHFASLSGNCDLCQILLYSGIDINVRNDFGETALHLASRKGSKRLLKSLLSINPHLLRQPDRKGMNPVGHAKFNRNVIGLNFLQDQLKKTGKIRLSFKSTDLLYGRGGSKFSLLFLVLVIYFWAVPVYVWKVLYVTYSDWPILNWVFIVDALLFTVNLYAVNSIEPNYLPRFTREYDDALKTISSRSQSEDEIQRKFSRLCHTCRTVRPLRASHCGICKRCVRSKDHHCPYVFNCIGFNNRQFFLLFLVTIWIAMTIGIVFAFLLFFQYGYWFLYHEFVGLGLLLMFYVFVNMVLSGTLYGALKNITTIESMKWNKYGYDYLRDGSSKFYNPFDKGALLNFLEYFRIIVEFKNDKRFPFDV